MKTHFHTGLLLLFNRPPIHEVCPNHEVTKPRKGTSPDLGYVAYCYVYTLFPSLPYLFASQCPPEEETHSCPSSHAIAGRPFCPFTGSSAHPGVPCLRPSMNKIPHLPRLLLHRFLRSPDCFLSPSVFNLPRHPSLPIVETSSSWTLLSLPLTGFCCRALATTKTFSILSLGCALGAFFIHWG